MSSVGTLLAANLASGALGRAGGALGSLFGKKGRRVGKAIGRSFRMHMKRGGVVHKYGMGGKVRVPPGRHFAVGGTVMGRRRFIKKVR